jgi:hypothetical protein
MEQGYVKETTIFVVADTGSTPASIFNKHNLEAIPFPLTIFLPFVKHQEGHEVLAILTTRGPKSWCPYFIRFLCRRGVYTYLCAVLTQKKVWKNIAELDQLKKYIDGVK